MQELIDSNHGHPDSSPTIAALEKLVAESEGVEKHNRQETLDAVVQVAEAWQILIRAGERQIAKAIDTVAQDMFMSSWTPVAVEVFMKHRPERKPQLHTTAGHEHHAEVAPGQITPAPVKAGAHADPDADIDGRQSQAIESAQWHVAQAWDILDGLQEEARTDAEKTRNMGVACFGETQFRAAMVKSRMGRLEPSE